MNRRDWVLHFGAIWPLFDGAKSYFDPDNILTPDKVFSKLLKAKGNFSSRRW